MLRFINTGFGDFTVLICLDFRQNDMLPKLFQKIDFLIVPSWNRDTVSFVTHAEDASREKWWFVALVNNGIYGQSGLYAPYKGDELDGLKGRIQGTNEEGVEYYTIDVLDLDRARDGSIRTRKDENIEVSPEEERIANKFRRLSDLAIEPRHRKVWENKKEESEEEQRRMEPIREKGEKVKSKNMEGYGRPMQLIVQGQKGEGSTVVKVFISYSEVDGRDLAKKLKKSLEKFDTVISAFFGAEDIDIGVSWESEIITTLSDCDVFIPILTVAACQSEWVQKEIGIAIRKKKRIIPCVHTQVNRIPDIIEGLQRITFEDKDELSREVLVLFNRNKEIK